MKCAVVAQDGKIQGYIMASVADKVPGGYADGSVLVAAPDNLRGVYAYSFAAKDFVLAAGPPTEVVF